MVGIQLPQPGARVSATCWCERAVVYIPADDVGTTTASCGRAGCQPPNQTPSPARRRRRRNT